MGATDVAERTERGHWGFSRSAYVWSPLPYVPPHSSVCFVTRTARSSA